MVIRNLDKINFFENSKYISTTDFFTRFLNLSNKELICTLFANIDFVFDSIFLNFYFQSKDLTGTMLCLRKSLRKELQLLLEP